MNKSFTCQFKGYAERVKASLRSQAFMSEMLAAEVADIAPGMVEISLSAREEMLQPHGNIHGIVASALADSAAGYAVQTLLPEGYDVVTVEYKMNYLAPGIGQKFIARGEVIRNGRSLSVSAAEVFAENHGQRKHFAHFITTMMAVES